MKHIRLLSSSMILAVTSILCHAQSADSTDSTATPLRPVYSAYQLSIGSNHHADTYLSPLKYSGWDAGFNYQRLQAMKFNPRNWVMQLNLKANFNRTLNPSGNASMLYAGIDASWAMMRRWKLPHELSVGVGPAITIDAGCYYLSRNGNNPASAKAAITLDASAYAAWSTHIGALPITFRYQAQLPAIGAFFAPDYGELYYEIYLGNHSGLAHCAWWGNYRCFDQQISADIRFGATWLRVGYSGRYFSSKSNDITTRAFTHSALIGLSGEWISLSPRTKISQQTEIISATY